MSEGSVFDRMKLFINHNGQMNGRRERGRGGGREVYLPIRELFNEMQQARGNGVKPVCCHLIMDELDHPLQ